jgi:hypothetical protein
VGWIYLKGEVMKLPNFLPYYEDLMVIFTHRFLEVFNLTLLYTPHKTHDKLPIKHIQVSSMSTVQAEQYTHHCHNTQHCKKYFFNGHHMRLDLYFGSVAVNLLSFWH